MKARIVLLISAALLIAAPVQAQEKKAAPAPAKVKVVKKTVEIVAPAPAAKVETKVEVKKVEAKLPAKVAAPASAPAVAPPVVTPTVPGVDPDDLGAILRGIIDSAKGGQWHLLAAFIIMLLTWLVNKVLKERIPSNVMPWVAIGLGSAAAVVLKLSTGAHWTNALMAGVQAGLIASGAWSAFGKHLPGLGKKGGGTPEAGAGDQPTNPSQK